MYEHISQMEPLLPSRPEALEDKAVQLISNSALLAGRLPEATQKTLTELLRITNSYYSNRIEGHSTHPVDIERAMHQDYATDPAKRLLQIESIAHIACQKLVEEKIEKNNNLNVASPEFLCWIHKEFYERLPEEFHTVRNENTGEEETVVPGKLRTREVQVGRHIGPRADSLNSFLERFASFYKRGTRHGVLPIIAVAASHQRLMWIHPFLDGNGRVARLYTDACLLQIPLSGYGMWNVSRGLARQRDDYMQDLAYADAHRQGDYDGRGNLSDKGITNFCNFFLDVCLDQTKYMRGLLETDTLNDRIKGYVKLRQEKVILPPKPFSPTIKAGAAVMLQEALLRGQVARGQIVSLAGMAERTGRDVLNQMLEEGLLVSDTPKGPVRLGLPTHFAQYLFPDLFPPGIG
ncbi:MAG: Fic family protein [Proteobacteria bacterium]|nr:Fic family protein [Pseudomonadota bacterium]MBU4599760.1 Fic family protein [Pseudomonadota bacterium]